jgi:hypothetical protein
MKARVTGDAGERATTVSVDAGRENVSKQNGDEVGTTATRV